MGVCIQELRLMLPAGLRSTRKTMVRQQSIFEAEDLSLAFHIPSYIS
jgi:hypothetical protein